MRAAEENGEYLEDGRLPAWEVPGALVKYRLTTQALVLAPRK